MTPDQIKAELTRRGWTIRQLAERAAIDENYLTKSLGKAGRRIQLDEMERILRALEMDQQTRPPIRHVPWLGSVPAGALKPALERANRFFAVSDPETPPRAYALTVEGDSMDEVVADGATIVIDPDDIDLWPGEYYVIQTADGQTTFKEYRDAPSRLIPLSTNKEHREIPLGREPITVLGRVYSITVRKMPRRRQEPRTA